MNQFLRILIGLFFCCVLLGGLWLALRPRSEPKVVKIYKTTLYQSEPSETPAANTVSETELSLEHRNNGQTDEVLLEDYALTPQEEAEFWKWFARLEAENGTEHFDETHAESNELEEANEPEETNTDVKLSYAQLFILVRETYELEDILSAYDIHIKPHGKGVCPFCSTVGFLTTVDRRTRRPKSWGCTNCNGGASGNVTHLYDFIDLVAKIEGIDKKRAVQHLAERAGLVE